MKIILIKDPMLLDIITNKFPSCLVLATVDIEKPIEVYEINADTTRSTD